MGSLPYLLILGAVVFLNSNIITTASATNTRWAEWFPCSKPCNRGLQYRNQECQNPEDGSWYLCNRMYAECNLKPCDDPWKFSDWTQCDKECDGGKRYRYSTTDPNRQDAIPCHKQDCTPPAGCGRADLVYVMDSSGSLGELNWYRLKQFTIDLVKSFKIAPDETRVGAVYYSTQSKVAFTLNQHQDEDSLEQALWNIPWMAGTTNTADGLSDAKKMFLEKRRSDVTQIAVVITDGASNIMKENTLPMAEELKSIGVEVFCIGIGEIQKSEIQGIAGEPKESRAFKVKDVNSLQEITGIVVKDTCDAATTPSTTPTTAPTQPPTAADPPPTTPPKGSSCVQGSPGPLDQCCLKELFESANCRHKGKCHPRNQDICKGQYDYWESLSMEEALKDMQNLYHKAFQAIVQPWKKDWARYTEPCLGHEAADVLPSCGKERFDDPAPYPNKYSLSCLRDAWSLAGCTEAGKYYPLDQSVNGGWWHRLTVREMLQDMDNMAKRKDWCGA